MWLPRRWGPDRYVFCTDDQQLVFLDFGQVSIKELSSREDVRLFPNPASTVLRVGGQDPGIWIQYAIRSLDGVLLASGTFPSAPDIPVSRLPNGVYLLTLWGESGMASGKFAVLR